MAFNLLFDRIASVVEERWRLRRFPIGCHSGSRERSKGYASTLGSEVIEYDGDALGESQGFERVSQDVEDSCKKNKGKNDRRRTSKESQLDRLWITIYVEV